jgi:hypothetical protein
VLRLIVAGNANKQMEDQLKITEETVKSRVKSILPRWAACAFYAIRPKVDLNPRICQRSSRLFFQAILPSIHSHTIQDTHDMAAQPLVDIFSYMRAFAPEMGERIIESYTPCTCAVRTHQGAAAQAAPRAGTRHHGDGQVPQVSPFREDRSRTQHGKTLMSMATCYVHADGRPFTALYMVVSRCLARVRR